MWDMKRIRIAEEGSKKQREARNKERGTVEQRKGETVMASRNEIGKWESGLRFGGKMRRLRSFVAHRAPQDDNLFRCC